MTQEEIKAIIRQEMPEILQDREMRDYYKNGLLIIGEIQSSISKSTILSAATPTRIQLQDSYFTDGRFQGAGNS
jgi:hypothetical protein